MSKYAYIRQVGHTTMRQLIEHSTGNLLFEASGGTVTSARVKCRDWADANGYTVGNLEEIEAAKKFKFSVEVETQDAGMLTAVASAVQNIITSECKTRAQMVKAINDANMVFGTQGGHHVAINSKASPNFPTQRLALITSSNLIDFK